MKRINATAGGVPDGRRGAQPLILANPRFWPILDFGPPLIFPLERPPEFQATNVFIATASSCTLLPAQNVNMSLQTSSCTLKEAKTNAIFELYTQALDAKKQMMSMHHVGGCTANIDKAVTTACFNAPILHHQRRLEHDFGERIDLLQGSLLRQPNKAATISRAH